MTDIFNKCYVIDFRKQLIVALTGKYENFKTMFHKLRN